MIWATVASATSAGLIGLAARPSSSGRSSDDLRPRRWATPRPISSAWPRTWTATVSAVRSTWQRRRRIPGRVLSPFSVRHPQSVAPSFWSSTTTGKQRLSRLWLLDPRDRPPPPSSNWRVATSCSWWFLLYRDVSRSVVGSSNRCFRTAQFRDGLSAPKYRFFENRRKTFLSYSRTIAHAQRTRVLITAVKMSTKCQLCRFVFIKRFANHRLL